MVDFIISARGGKAKFDNEPGPSRYLFVDEAATTPVPQKNSAKDWLNAVLGQATWGKDSRTGGPRGDILIYVHGYQNSPEQVLRRHRLVKGGLAELGYKGAVVSFDWPSANQTAAYLEDRHDAKQSAMQLVTDGIRLLAETQTPDCTVNIHVLAHSMGAYVVREAFDDAEDAKLKQSNWMVSQIMLVSGDVSQASLANGESASKALYNHCIRLTNYSNGHDSVLKISNAKRIGLAPRVGRVGLPKDVPGSAVNVDCSDYFKALQSSSETNTSPYVEHQFDDLDPDKLSFAHSWYHGNRWLLRDVFETIKGDVDRALISTRTVDDGILKLRIP